MPLKQLSPKLKPSINFEALGTRWFIEVESGISSRQEDSVYKAIDRIDRVWSRFRDDSLVTQMSLGIGDHSLSAVDRQLMEWYRLLYEVTDGHVTPLIGQTLADAGYDASYRLVPRTTIAQTPIWEETIHLTDKGITINRPVMLDVGAAGKGFAIDAVAHLFDGESYIIDAGGDMRMHGKMHTIGMEHPFNKDELIGTVNIKNKSICGSAGNRRKWGDWHHIIDPMTSRPVENVAATWAVADTAMHADGIASALFFLLPEQLRRLGNFTYVVMYDNGEVYHSDTVDIRLFT